MTSSLNVDALAAIDVHVQRIAAYYRDRQMACVVFTVDAEAVTGLPPVPNEEVAQAAASG